MRLNVLRLYEFGPEGAVYINTPLFRFAFCIKNSPLLLVLSFLTKHHHDPLAGDNERFAPLSKYQQTSA